MAENLDNLPPEEWIKKLRELKEKKKKEIEEAEKAINESHEEISDQQKWVEKVPIPEFSKEDLVGLSEEGKEILKEKGIVKKEEVVEEKETIEKEEENLEETVLKEDVPEVVHPKYEIRDTEQLKVVYKLSEEPVAQLYTAAKELNQAVESKGYASREDEVRAQQINSALEKRVKEVYGGSLTQEVAMKTQLTKQLSTDVQMAYKGHAGKDKPASSYQSSSSSEHVYQKGHGGGSS